MLISTRTNMCLQPSRAINAVFLLAVKTWSACTSPLRVQVMMAIVSVRSIPFATSSKEPAKCCGGQRGGVICRRPAGVSVANIVLLSADEAEARWLRPEEPGRARVGKAQCQRGGAAMPASLCGPAMPCEMTGRVMERPGAFFPSWPVRAPQLVGSQFETDWEMTFWNFLRDGRGLERFSLAEGVCVAEWDRRWNENTDTNAPKICLLWPDRSITPVLKIQR